MSATQLISEVFVISNSALVFNEKMGGKDDKLVLILDDKLNLYQPICIFSAPGSGPVTSNNIFGFRTDILLQLLNIKARRAYPGTTNISEIVPMLLKHLYETMEKNDTSVRSCDSLP